MPWKAIPEPSKEERKQIAAEFGKKARFLVDENLDGDTREVIKALGWNTKGVAELGLSGHSDEDVLAAAWREDRMLITNDRDFLDETRFPEHRNPGVIILPVAPLESDAFLGALGLALSTFGPFREAYKKCKIEVNQNGEISIRRRNITTGKMEKQRLRSDDCSTVHEWNSEEE